MDPAVVGARVASAAVAPLVKKLFVREGPGAGLLDRPVRLSGHLSFTGEKRTLTERDLRKLAAELVRRALAAGERPVPEDEEEAVADALARSLHALGDLAMDDVQAVRLGHTHLARELHRTAGHPDHLLSADAAGLYERLLDTACLHVLHFFTQRSSFVARSAVEQARSQAELIAKTDELLLRVPRPDGRDTAFEERYAAYVAEKHGTLTIVGIDLHHTEAVWPLDTAYLSLELQDRDPSSPGFRVTTTGCPSTRTARTRRTDSRSRSTGTTGPRRPRSTRHTAARRPDLLRPGPRPAPRCRRFRQDHPHPVAGGLHRPR